MVISTRALGIAIAAAAVASSAPAAASAAVFGGSTATGAAIVINADKKARAVRSAVVSWSARCDDGSRFPVAMPVKAVAPEPGFEPDAEEFATSRNGKGRFAGTQLAAFRMDDRVAAFRARYAGTLTAKRAHGTLAATVTVVESASGDVVVTCRTGTVRWSATRAPGRVFGGSTSQGYPVVARLDAKRRIVGDLLFGWSSETCKPDDVSLSVDDRFSKLPLSDGHFGRAFDLFYSPDGGGEGKVGYDIAGRIAGKRTSGTLRVNLTETDPSGAVTTACDSGSIAWSAVTG